MKRNSTLLSAVAMILILLVGFTRAATTQAAPLAATNTSLTLPNPILFVTQMPFPSDFTTINAVFGNHKGSMQDAPRGGDLWIRYPDGSLKNLTAAAGYGSSGLQGANAIAVRDSCCAWRAKLDAITSSTISATPFPTAASSHATTRTNPHPRP